MDEIWWLSAVELGQHFRARALGPVEVTEALLARIDALNGRLNAFLTVTADEARAAARAAEARYAQGAALSALDGVPYSLKDLEPTKGIRTTYGSRFFADHLPPYDGLAAQRLRASPS
jgi:Asp-tRNA(Asn)/Glu-tRNA(Gln) amidotransferase A subunit family amidase